MNLLDADGGLEGFIIVALALFTLVTSSQLRFVNSSIICASERVRADCAFRNIGAANFIDGVDITFGASSIFHYFT